MNHRYNVSHYSDMSIPNQITMPFGFYPKRVEANTQIAWLRQSGLFNHHHNHLFEKFTNAGMSISFLNSEALSTNQLLTSDLILFESQRCIADRTDHDRTHKMLGHIRCQSRAPLVLLTDEQPIEWYISAIHSGADAILPLSTANEIILAHCNALLRRWRPKN